MQYRMLHLGISNLHFSSDAKQLELSCTMTLGKRRLVWNHGSGNGIDAEKLIRFAQNALASYSLHRAYDKADLTTAFHHATVTCEAGGAPYRIRCDLELNGEAFASAEVWPGHLGELLDQLNRTIIIECCHNFSPEVTAYWSDILRGKGRPSRFSVGQAVRTVINRNVKTFREGWVYAVSYHDKRDETIYNLLIGERVHRKWYFDADLILKG